MINCLCEGMVCVKGWFVWRDLIQRMINVLCEGMVCVKGGITENDKWFVWLSCLCGWFVWTIPVLCSVLHAFTQNIFHFLYFIPSHQPSLHTNHPFTQTIHHSLYYILSGLHEWLSGLCGWFVWAPPVLHIISLHTNQIICNTGMVCVKPFIISLCTNQIICNTEKGRFVWRDGLCEGMVFVKGCFVWTCTQTSLHTNQILYNPGMVHTNYSHKPDNHKTIHHSRYYILSHKPSLHTNHSSYPFTQTR